MLARPCFVPMVFLLIELILISIIISQQIRGSGAMRAGSNNAGWERARQRHPHHHGIDDAPPTWLPTPPRCGQHTLRPLFCSGRCLFSLGRTAFTFRSGKVTLYGTRSPALTPRGVGTASDRSLRPRNPRCVCRSPEAHEGPRPVPGLPTAPAQAAGSLALPVRLRRPPESRHDGVQRTAAAGGAPGRRRAGTSAARACRRCSGTAHPGRRGRPGGGAPPSAGEGGAGRRGRPGGGAPPKGGGGGRVGEATGRLLGPRPLGRSLRALRHAATPSAATSARQRAGERRRGGGRSGPPPTGSGRPPVTAGHDGGEEEGGRRAGSEGDAHGATLGQPPPLAAAAATGPRRRRPRRAGEEGGGGGVGGGAVAPRVARGYGNPTQNCPPSFPGPSCHRPPC
ncbi:hypothetical protein SORBI_3005G205550 [Sorghum bicolor]|uniref:Uncharacterized protein n=1 Tax=Sorghum bicolor TaxID=4558 RepID=A0A1Z5RJQ2_SORBI|nr:hypothetical protein SORBI_3005G205550 [Sorghum bicolor]